MTEQSLQQLLDASGNIVELLRNQQSGPNVYPGVPAEYSNWRSEQQAWAQTCVLFNQSFHMVDLAVEGPDAFACSIISASTASRGSFRIAPSNSYR
jgi:glycine cleavage system aminomethyltransferase T